MKSPLIRLSLVVFLLALSGAAWAQVIYSPYYGKNKINYENFDWNKYSTDHYEIYYYVDDLSRLKRIAELAESAYQKISHQLKYELSSSVPLIYYKSYTDFEQTNLAQVSEGILGFAEPILYRFVVRGDMSDDELLDLIEHELTHIFQYDLLYGGPGAALYALSQPPGWAIEGYAEYNTKEWSFISELTVRDAVLSDRIPELNEGGNLFSRSIFARPVDYDFGHAIFDFIESQYGANAVREFWASMKNSSLFRRNDPVKKIFEMTPKEFNFEFKRFLRDKYKDFVLRENPEDYSVSFGPEFPLNPFYFSFSHALSPSGDIVAVVTYNVRDSDIDIVLLSTKDGRPLQNITRKFSLKYEYIRFGVDPSKGKNLSWSADGTHIAFFGRSGQKYSLIVVDILSGKTVKDIKVDLDSPEAPCFFPSGQELLFTAFDNGRPDIFKLDLETGSVVNLTNDDLFEKAPSISPDGKSIAYTIRIDVFDKIFLSPLDNLRKKTQLTFGRGNTITPVFSPDSKKIYFSADMMEAFNIYSLDIESGLLVRYTDVRTGNFFPEPDPSRPQKLIFSSFNKSAFQLYSGEFKGEPEKTIAFVDVEGDEEFARFEPILTLEIKKDEIKPHKGMGKLYLMSRPPIDTIVSTDGSIYGGSALSFSDLLGDNMFFLMAYQVRSFRSYYFSYLNQKKRFQYMASAYSYSIFYYPDYAYYDPYLYNLMTYQDAIAVRKISGLTLAGYYPFNRYYRAEFALAFNRYEEDFYDPYINQLVFGSGSNYGYFFNGNALVASTALVGETTRFNFYGPKSGNTFRISLAQTIPVTDSFFSNTTAELDFRHYLPIGGDTLFAFRFNGFFSRGKNPFIFYFGGNNQVRSSYYYNIICTEGWFANFEFRLPLVSSASTLIGQIGPVRGTLFVDITRAKLKGQPAKFYRYEASSLGGITLIQFDALGSFGYGFEFFFLGIPIHLEFVKRLEFPDMSTPFKFDTIGDFQTKFWIGFDF